MPERTSKQKTALARNLRKNSTWAERLMWSWIRDRRFSGYKFRREHNFGECILDFFCVEAFLNIELDGGGHAHPKQQEADRIRDTYLKDRGVKTLRFWNGDLRKGKDIILEAIWNELQTRAPKPLSDAGKPDSGGMEGSVP